MKNQDDIFMNGEADAWYKRNAAALAPEARAGRDLVEQLIRSHKLRPRRVLDVGAGNGWRIEALRRAYPKARYTGVEPSQKALTAGKKLFPELNLRRGVAAKLPVKDGSADLVLAVFVFHWIARDTLLRSVAEIDRVLRDGGHLIVCDFLPRTPRKNPYGHRAGVYTWKTDYGRLFENSGNYVRAGRLYAYTADARGRRSEEFRAAATLYIKRTGAGYRESK